MPDIKERVQKRYSELSSLQKRIISNILNTYDDLIFLSVDEAAKILGVHKSTLVRLSQNLGYPGYSNLRSDLQELYRGGVAPHKKLGKTLSEVGDEDLFRQLVETEILYLQESLKTIQPRDIKRAAKLIIRAKRIFLCARGPQIALAQLLEYRLRRFHLDVHTVFEEGRAVLEQIQLITSSDVLILYSFLSVLKEQRIAITIAGELSCPIVMISDTVAKEMTQKATVTLASRRGPSSLYHTNIVPLAIQSAMVLQVARLQAPKVLDRLDHLQKLRQRFGFDYTLTGKSKEDHTR